MTKLTIPGGVFFPHTTKPKPRPTPRNRWRRQMQWLKNLLGIKTAEEKLRQQLKDLEQKVFEATRKGDLEEAGRVNLKMEEVIMKLHNIDDTS